MEKNEKIYDKLFTICVILSNIRVGYYKENSPTRTSVDKVIVPIDEVNQMRELLLEIGELLWKI